MSEKPKSELNKAGEDPKDESLPKELTSPTLRRGKWTPEEERYTEKIIMDFENGTLDVPEGTTLRTYLSRVLNCDPMRITKKYTGNSSIGKRTFTPLLGSPENLSFINMSRKDLENLRQIWVNKLQIAEQWNQRKIGFMKNSGKLFIPQELFTIAAEFPTTSSLASAVGTDQHMLIDFANYAKAQEQGVALHDEKIALALQPFCNNPAELNYLMHWLKSSVHAIQHATSPQDLDQLIQIGELSLPNLFEASSLSSSQAHNQQAQQQQPRQNGYPQLEDLQRVIEAYFDHRNLPSDVAYRVYRDDNNNQGSSGSSRRKAGNAASSSAEKKRSTLSKNNSPQPTSSPKQQVTSGNIEVKLEKEAHHTSSAPASIPSHAHRSPMLQQGEGQVYVQRHVNSIIAQQAQFASMNHDNNVTFMHANYAEAARYNTWQSLMPLPALPPTLASSANMMRPSSSGSSSSSSENPSQPQFMQLMGTTVKLPPRQSWLEDTLPVSSMGLGRHHNSMYATETKSLDAYGMVAMMPQSSRNSSNTHQQGDQQSHGHSSKSTTPHSITSNCNERMTTLSMSSDSTTQYVPKSSSRAGYKYDPEMVLPQQQKRKTEHHHNQHSDAKKARARQEKADVDEAEAEMNSQQQKATIENAAQALLGLFQG